jgi:hypothetical protein
VLGPEQRIVIDPVRRPLDEGRGAVDPDEGAISVADESAEQPARAAAEIDDRPLAAAGLLAIEDEVLGDLVVLEVVQLGQGCLIGGLAGKDVAQLGRPRPPPSARSSAQAASTSPG